MKWKYSKSETKEEEEEVDDDERLKIIEKRWVCVRERKKIVSFCDCIHTKYKCKRMLQINYDF